MNTLCKHQHDERTCADCVVESVFRVPMTPIAVIMSPALCPAEECAHA